MTFKRPTGVYFIRAGESAAMKALPRTLLTLVMGWWGIPWGFIYTPMALFTNLSGGKDVTQQHAAGRLTNRQRVSRPGRVAALGGHFTAGRRRQACTSRRAGTIVSPSKRSGTRQRTRSSISAGLRTSKAKR